MDSIARRACCLLCLCLCLCLPAQAATPAEPGRTAMLCAIRQQELLVSYYLYASKPHDPANLQGIGRARDNATDCVNRTRELLDAAGQQDRAGKIGDQFALLGTRLGLNTDAIAHGRSIGSDPLLEMVDDSQRLTALLQLTGRDAAGTDAAGARELAGLIRYANVVYMERSTYAFGVTLHRQSNGEPDGDRILERISRGMARLGDSPGLDAAQRRKLENARTKFNFIRGTMQLNYGHRTLPFSVNYYIDSIVQSLLDVADALDAGRGRTAPAGP